MEILFRGKRKDNGEWVEGDFILGVGAKHGEAFILPRTHIMPNGCNSLNGWDVDPATVGQIAKVLGQKIAVGDILHCFNAQSTSPDKPFGATEIVEFKEGCLWLRYRHMPIIQFLQLSNGNKYHVSVVGNIFDNPELLK
jgi:hypothetical protein